MDCCNTITKSLIVTTINPIWGSRPVHPGIKRFTICSLKSKENIIFAHNYFKNETQTKHPIALIFISVYFPCRRIRYLKQITINTHIDCANNSKCSVRDILRATTQGAFESVFGTFSVRLTGLWFLMSLLIPECVSCT